MTSAQDQILGLALEQLPGARLFLWGVVVEQLRVRPVRAELVQAAMRRSESSQLSYRDALIVETAVDAGTSTLLAEDLQDGQVFDGLRVVNPFRG